MRGNLCVAVLDLLCQGSIPACAGEPVSAIPVVDRDPVYPRVFGGTLYLHATTNGAVGLPPRVRGTRVIMSFTPHSQFKIVEATFC